MVTRWRDDKQAPVCGYIIDDNSKILAMAEEDGWDNTPVCYNIFATEAQAKSALAMARISQIMANDPRFGGVVTDEEWSEEPQDIFVIVKDSEGDVVRDQYPDSWHFLAFHTAECRDLFLQENRDLVEQFLMIHKKEKE